MASLAHAVVGGAAARFVRRGQTTIFHPVTAAVIWAGLSLLPDADVFGFKLGVHYGDPFGHRGATHSFAFALLVGVAAAGVARACRLPARRIAVLVAGVVASHALLDTLTDGGLGCALLWPFSNERFFAPVRPLPVAPIGRAFLSREGLRIAAFELLVSAPLLLYAVWPAPRRPPTG
jgi:inner membrane protein